jgi:predicted ATPase
MITKIEVSGYRCLRHVEQSLQPWQVLVGPNGSGKSAFLDVIAFLGDLTSGTLKDAVRERSESFYDLVWGRDADRFHMAIEARKPSDPNAEGSVATDVRFEIELRIDASDDEIKLSTERLSVANRPDQWSPVIVRDGDRLSYSAETAENKFAFRLSPTLSGLANLPLDETTFPGAVWLRSLLRDGVKTVALDNELLRAAGPPGQGKPRIYDGFNLARLVEQLRGSNRSAFDAWLGHVRTAIADLVDIKTILRPEDKYRYLLVQYAGGLEVPAWMVSDGTLRLLALTLLAYLPGPEPVYLVEEPEVGIHPTAIETVIQSLLSVYDGQVLITSHSPAVLSLPSPEQLLCFQRTSEGTTIIPGNEHPLLKEWKAGINVSDLFAAGVLG